MKYGDPGMQEKLLAESCKNNNGKWVCSYCELSVEPSIEALALFQLDHKEPDKGDEEGNLRLACRHCNIKKSDKPFKEDDREEYKQLKNDYSKLVERIKNCKNPGLFDYTSEKSSFIAKELQGYFMGSKISKGNYPYLI